VRLDPAFPLGDGKKDLCDAVTDIILHHIFYIQACNQDSCNRVEQVREVEVGTTEISVRKTWKKWIAVLRKKAANAVRIPTKKQTNSKK
jgi:hypothetical protein